ncbi:MAG: CoB--CoM heterodisulfide reductase iron-sulfur subunit B family protein [bacterium]|jgi:heterodisulfide reductase subunit B
MRDKGNGKIRFPRSEYLYYPGCSLEHTGLMYDTSARAVMKALGSSLKELDDWNCCGATSYMSIRELRAFAVSSRNLALAEMSGADQLVTVCSACFTTLGKTNRYFREDATLRARIKDALAAADLKYDGSLEVRHLLDVIVNDFGVEEVKKRAKRGLSGMKVAPYYGCQISRPHGTFDDPENPSSFDPILSALGADVLRFPLRARCCGGMQMITSSEAAIPLVRDLLKCAKDEGAECIVCFCPLCHVNLDCYTGAVERKFGEKYAIPIIYFTQVLGLALGLSAKQLDIGRELVDTSAFVEKYAAEAAAGASA